MTDETMKPDGPARGADLTSAAANAARNVRVG